MSFNQKTLALILEVTHGCQYSCSGCTVNKDSCYLPNAEGFARLKAFIDSMEDNGVDLVELELGPTEILSSFNRDEVFSHPDFRELVKRFRLFTLITGLLLPKSEEYVRLIDQINDIASDSSIELVTPVEFKHVFNDKYLSVIRNNIQIFKERLKGNFVGVILQINFDARFVTQREIGMPSYQDLFERIHSLDMPVMTKVNFSFPHGRKGFNEAAAANFVDSVKAVNELYMRDLQRRGKNAEPRHVPYQLHTGQHGGEVVWHNDKMFIRPIINERFTVLNSDREFSEPWTFDSFFERSIELTNQSLDKGFDFSDCQSCPHLVTCANRGVHEIMSFMGTQECISLLKDFGHLQADLQNGNFQNINWSEVHVGK